MEDVGASSGDTVSTSSYTPVFVSQDDFGSSAVELAETPDPLDEINAALATIQYNEADAEVFEDYAQLVWAGGGLAYATQAVFDDHLESYWRFRRR